MDPAIESLIIAYDSATTSDERNVAKVRIDQFKQTHDPSRGYESIQDAAHKRPQYAFNRYRVNNMAETANTLHFKLSPNQIFLKKWLSPDTYNQGILLYHSVGVGKSCTSIHIAENFKDMYKRRALVILPKSLKANYMRELNNPVKAGNQCVGSTYIARTEPGAKDNDKKNMRLIRRSYELVAFGEFANSILRMQHDVAYIRETYSNRVIIIDEVHNIRASVASVAASSVAASSVAAPAAVPAAAFTTETDYEVTDPDDVDDTVDTNDEKKKASMALLVVLKHAVNTKLILMSATPVYNDADEIRWLMTLLYTHAQEHKQVDNIQKLNKLFDSNNVLTKNAHSMISKFANRFVSYMNSNPFTFPARLYPTINNDPAILQVTDFPNIDALTGKPISNSDQIKQGLVMIAHAMGAVYQEPKYIEACGKHQAKDLSRPIQISNIAYPTNSKVVGAAIGGKDLTTWFESDPKNGFRYRKNIVDTYGEFLAPGPDHLSKYSPKIASIIDYIKSSTGVVLVYSRYIWSGIVPLAIALEHQGYTRHGNIPLLKSSTTATVPPAGKYIILTSSEWISPEAQRQAAIMRASSADNNNGGHIKVILVTDVAAEGVDYKNVREIHIMEPWYNMKKIEQIIGRGVRNNSHIYLTHPKRNCTIYHHVALLSKSETGPNRESVDFRNYRLSYNKQRRVEAIECVLQQNSLDCNLNIDVRNVSIKAEDIETSQGTYVPNFVRQNQLSILEPCDAVCKPSHAILETQAHVGLRPQIVRYEADHYAMLVRNIFADSIVIDRVSIAKKLGVEAKSTQNELLDLALETMVSQRTIFKGHNQRSGYLLRVNGSYVFQPTDIADTKITVVDRNIPKRKIVTSIPIKESSIGTGVTIGIDVVAGAKIITRINADYKKLKDLLAVNTDDDAIVYDMVIDRLPQDALMYILVSNIDNRWKESLDRNGYMYTFEKNPLLYLPEINLFKIYRNGVLSDLPDAFVTRAYTMIGTYMRNHVGDDALVPIEGQIPIPGFVAYDKNGVALLKLLNKTRGQGSFCEATATFTVDFMKNNIKAASNGKASEDFGKVSKQGLCYIYEYWLRQKNTKVTPYFHNRVIHAYKNVLKTKPPKK